MMIRPPYLWLAMSVAICGCQSAPEQLPFPERLQSWSGAHFDQLVQAWGLPARHAFETGTGFAEWQNSKTSRGPTVSIGLGSHGGRISSQVGTTIHGAKQQQTCVIQVKFNSAQLAVELSYKGPESLCEPLVPSRNEPEL